MSSKGVEIERLVEEICGLDLSSAAELAGMLEERLGLPKGGMIGVAAGGVGGTEGAGGKEEEKTEFMVVFEGYIGEKKISVIKAVRECTSLGLKEAKDFVEQEGEKELIEGKRYKKEEAEELRKKLEEAGAKVSIK